MIYKRGAVYWHELRPQGERVRDTTHTGNKEAARQIESAERVRLAKGEAGIKERGPYPTLAEFAPRFTGAIETVCAGEHNREFVLSHQLEPAYLAAAPQPLRDVAILILETAVRPGEAVGLEWADVRLQPAVHAKYGYLVVRSGKSPYAKRNLSLTARVAEMLKTWKAGSKSAWVFPGETDAAAILGTSLDHQHEDVREALKLPADFVIHSLRHTMLTRLGEAGADAFTIMRIVGHSSVMDSQRYVHPTPEGMERAFERLAELNRAKAESAVCKTLSKLFKLKIRALSSAVRAADS